ncbi:MAG: hypothetical protein C3F06_05885 [Candidatus Methanoperedenaceae archaeon]|nr:MAG: hypothetical protein C3F06_05885 [Candidatus Methanoperedenaceae archaeon]
MKNRIKIPTIFKLINVQINIRVYLINLVLGLILLFYSIWEIKPVVVEITDFLGLISHLTTAYWAGFILIISSFIKLYFDKKIESKYIYILYSLIFGLFIFSVPIFAEENARFPWSYYPAGEVKTVLETKYIDTISEYPLISYRSWPATHIISAFIISFANIKIDFLLKYMPLFWVFFVTLFIFSIGLHFKLSEKQCLLVSLLFLFSFWEFHNYYGPQYFGYLLYILFLFILFKYKNEYKDRLFIIITFCTIVITHLLTAIAVISSFIFSSKYIRSIYERRLRFLLFFLIAFISWHVYLAPEMLKVGTRELITQIAERKPLSFFGTTKYEVGILLTRQITHYSRIFYLVFYTVGMTIAAFLYLTNRVIENNREIIKICFFWLIGILMLFIFRYGESEIDDRIYILSLIPMIYILILSFNQKVVLVLAILLMIPHLPAHYGSESNEIIYSSELSGDKFFSQTARLNSYNQYLYAPSPGIRFYNNSMVLFDGFSIEHICSEGKKHNFSSYYDVKYIMLTKQFNNFLLYSCNLNVLDLGFDFQAKNTNYIYNNGDFNIYYIK